jgi:hypothetical protein
LKTTSEYPSLFSNADLSLAAGKMRENSWSSAAFGTLRYYFTESQATSCKHFQYRIKIAAIGSSSKRVTVLEGFSKLVSNFKGAIENFQFDFFFQETKNCKNYQRMYSKYIFIIISLQKKFIW